MEDYTKEIEFWKRLQSFVSDVQTNGCMDEEEKQMIIHSCKLKILDLQRVSNAVCGTCKTPLQLFNDGRPFCPNCLKIYKANMKVGGRHKTL